MKQKIVLIPCEDKEEVIREKIEHAAVQAGYQTGATSDLLYDDLREQFSVIDVDAFLRVIAGEQGFDISSEEIETLKGSLDLPTTYIAINRGEVPADIDSEIASIKRSISAEFDERVSLTIEALRGNPELQSHSMVQTNLPYINANPTTGPTIGPAAQRPRFGAVPHNEVDDVTDFVVENFGGEIITRMATKLGAAATPVTIALEAIYPSRIAVDPEVEIPTKPVKPSKPTEKADPDAAKAEKEKVEKEKKEAEEKAKKEAEEKAKKDGLTFGDPDAGPNAPVSPEIIEMFNEALKSDAQKAYEKELREKYWKELIARAGKTFKPGQSGKGDCGLLPIRLPTLGSGGDFALDVSILTRDNDLGAF